MAVRNIREVEKIIDIFKKELINQGIKIIDLYLFGSYINGTPDEWSDIDIAVVCEKDIEYDRFDLHFKLMNIAKEIDIDIEPHIFFKEDFSKSNPIAYQIIEFGKKIA